MRADFHHLLRTRLCRAVARTLIFLMVFQNFPVEALNLGTAEAAGTILFVDALGSCGGETPCYTRIQAAIDAATAGQTVRVLPGEYPEQLRLSRKNTAAVTDADRITIEADPASPVGAVVLRGSANHCQHGYALDISHTRLVTFRGLTFAGAGFRGIRLRGGSRQNVGIRFERNRMLRGGADACMGGIEIGRGNVDTLLANNLLYDLDRHAIRFRHAQSGNAVVVGNTIVRNGWNGIFLGRISDAKIWNNVIAFNGTARGGRGGGKFGIRRQRVTKPRASDLELKNNLICGNTAGEFDGPALDASDAHNLTPTGGEGPGVVASPACGVLASVFAHVAGPDGILDSVDDDFTLAAGSPALGTGLDPRVLGTNVPNVLFEADYFAPGVRPGDARFNIGAVEDGGPTPPTPTTTAIVLPTPSRTTTPVVATPSPTSSPTPTRTTTAGGPALTPSPTRTATVGGLTHTPTPTSTSTPGGPNHPPVAHDDEYAVEVATTLPVPALGVLGNDEDPDGNPLTATLVDPPLLGSLTAFNPNGSFIYEAPANFVQPGLNPTVTARYLTDVNHFGNVADFNRDGFPDLLYLAFGAIRALDGRDGTRLLDFDPSDTTAVDITGCNTNAATSTVAVGDIDDSGDVSVVSPLACPDGIDRFVGINGSQINGSGKVHASWVTERLTKPHPDTYVGPNATEPADPPLRPYLAFGAAGFTEPTLARLEAAGGVKLLARNLLGDYQGYYYTKNDQGVVELRYAGCRAFTGLPADEGKLCRVTWIINAANGAVEEVLTAPNPSAEIDTYTRRPLRENTPIVADLDGDGEVEIISGSDVFTRVGGVWTLAWQTQYEPVSVAVADLDGDGTSEVIQDQHHYVNGKTDADTGLFIYAHDGTLIRRIPVVVPLAAAQGFLSIGDADGDGQPDILYVADGILSVYRADGRLLWLVVLPDRPEPNGVFIHGPAGLQGRSGETAPQVYDLDLDGKPEVILNAATRLFIFDGRTGAEKYSIDTEGNPGYGNKTLALADIDDDSHVDIVAMSSEGWNCSALTGGPVDCKGSTLVVSGADHNWAPGPKIFNQINFRPDAVNDAAKILFAPGARRDFRRAEQEGTVVDPRLRAGTTFTYTANDATTSSAPATVFLKIRPDNSPPTITSLPPTGLLSTPPYTRPIYQIAATDPDPGDVLHYELVSTTHPFGGATETTITPGIGVSLDPSTGAVSFYVDVYYNFGDVAVVVAAIDTLGARAEQSFIVTIGTSTATVPNVVGQSQATAITTIQNANLRPRIVLETFDAAPAGTVIAQTPVSGTANVAIGTSVDLTISKGPIPTATPTPTPTFTPDPNATVTPIPPVDSIVVEPVGQILIPGQPQQFTATAVFADGTAADVTAQATWNSSVGAAATVVAGGLATAVAAGITTISATFAGVPGGTALGVLAKVPSDFVDPTAEITSPANGSEVIEPLAVVGTATDANFLKYELALALAGETDFTVIKTGNAPVTNGVLGQLDPTLLINDLYDLKLTVFDRNGNTTETQVGVQIARDQKVGAFSITFTDLEIPLSGIPIAIERTYDSRDKAKGDFGVGWRLHIDTMRVRPNREQGSGWVVNQVGGGFGAFVLVPNDEHKVSLTLPDGKVEVFDLLITPSVSPLLPLETVTASYVPRPGTLGTLTALADNDLLVVGPQPGDVELVTFATAETYNPKLFRYVGPNGDVVDIDRKDGVERLQDRNNNTLTIGTNGIVHSSGRSVAFTRDGQGRITQITDPDGHSQTYAYDGRGDLIRHTSAVGNLTRFTYNRTHGLLDIIDPAGTRAARNEYDDEGRLIATVDPQGKRTEFTHTLGTSQEVVTDRLGHVTVYEYDTAGNVVSKADALGGLTTYTYDGSGNQLSETDPVGRVSTKTYDPARNVLTDTDFDGNTTTFTYNPRRQVLTKTDPQGRTTTNVYDAAGNLTQTTSPEGGVTVNTFDAAGNQTTATDPLGHVTTTGYDAAGNTTSVTTPLSYVTTLAYDGGGRVLGKTDANGHLSQFAYDDDGRVTGSTEGGRTSALTYATIGDGQRLLSSTNPNGGVTAYAYDVRGNKIATTFPDGSTETATFDAESHQLSTTDRDGHTTLFEYDALGHPTKITNPDGTTVLKTYDAAGRLKTQTDERGNVTTYGYGTNQQTVTDALGHATVHEFDDAQHVTKTTDALGHVTTFAYDSRGNLTLTTYPNGTTSTATYDLAGRKTAETDQAGHTLHYTYDASGRLTAVTNAEGGLTSYGYDPLGNRTTETDANGHVTELHYDAANRLVARIRPLGQQETFAYDGDGNQISHTDFNGNTITFTYDLADRLQTKTPPGGPVVVYAYTGSGLRTQAGGDVTIYDVRGHVLTDTKTNGDVLTYTYDAAGNRTSLTTPEGTTTFTYDALNRIATVVDSTGTTTYGYDAVGNLVSTAYPNGVTTTYVYDTLNRLTQMANTGPGGLISSYTYTLGLAGNRTKVVEAGSATTGRTVTYTYDDVYRLVEEDIDEPGAANDVTVAYTYDAVGNRTVLTRNGTPTTSTYDDNDRLLTATTGAVATTFVYDDNGNLASRTIGANTDLYTYDGENRLVDANLQTGVNPESASYTYDADGIRISKTAGSATTTYLVDKTVPFARVVVETTGASTTTYTHGHQLISQTATAGGTHFYVADGQLSTRQLTTTAGAVSDTYTYDAFGVALSESGSTTNLYRYTGEQLDPNVGFYYLRARYYAQQHGRFITTDPEVGNVFEPTSLHRYLYAHADPVNNVDPSGRAEFSILGLTIVINVQAILIGAFANALGTFTLSYLLTSQPPSISSMIISVSVGAVGTIVEAGITSLTVLACVLGGLSLYLSLRFLHITQDISNGEFDNLLVGNILGAFASLLVGRAATAANGGLIFGFVLAVILGVPLGAGADAGAQIAQAVDKDAKLIFWYKVNKYPQPIKKFIK